MKKKIFFPAVAVFLLLIAAVMLVRSPKQPGVLAPLQEAVKAGIQNLQINALPFVVTKEGAGGAWSQGTVGGAPAWRDNKTGVIWGPRIKDLALFSLLPRDLAAAKEACAKQNPAGSWALPLSKEFSSAKIDGLAEADKDAQGYWITFTVSKTMGELPQGFILGKMPGQRIFSVRCVGHGAK
jgi:hypothetical protein